MSSKQPPVFLTARWRYLAMLNYEIDPDVLHPLVPDGTTLDTWNTRTLVSVVAFRFLDTRLRWIPFPLYRSFDEINLRFYVRRETDDGPRRGVVFIKELVPHKAIAWVARSVYNENYMAMPLRHDITLPTVGGSSSGHIRYEWSGNGSWNNLEIAIAGTAQPFALDSEEAFITEHYWGYARHPEGGTLEYQVEHPPWKVWTALKTEIEGNFGDVCGPEFRDALRGAPRSAFVADGSPVVVRQGRPLPT